MSILVFCTGFEHNVAAASSATGTSTNRLWDSINGSPVIETTTVHHGTKALRINPSAATEYVNRALGTGNRRIVGSFYFYIVTMPTGGDFRLISTSTTAGGQVFTITTGGAIVARPADNTGDAVTGPTLSAGTWYRLDFDFDTSGTNHSIAWRVDGSAQTTAVTSDSPGAQDQTNFRIGTTLSATADVIYDCFVYSFTGTDYPLGEHYVLGYAPSADGTHGSTYAAKFRDAAGTDISGSNPAWDNLLDPSTTTTRVEQYARVAGEDATTYVEVAFADSSESTAPVAVMGIAAIRAAATTADNLTVRIRDGSTDADIFSGDPSQTTLAHMVVTWATKPSGGAWSDTAFDALVGRLGFSSDINPVPWCASIYLEAAFVVAGTQFNQSVAGTLTTAGAAIEQGQKALAATLSTAGTLLGQAQKVLAATLTTVGVLVKQSARTLAATLTTAGAFIPQAQKALAGTLTTAGVIVAQTQKSVSGTLATVGALVKESTRIFVGTLATAGALNAIKIVLLSLTATLTTGAILIRQTSTNLTAALASDGALLKETARALVGTLATVGALEAVRTVLVSLTGTLTTGAALVRQTGTAMIGALSSSGVLVRETARALMGTLTTSGVLNAIRMILVALTATLTAAATLTLQATGSAVGAGARRLIKALQRYAAQAGLRAYVEASERTNAQADDD